MKPTFTFIRTAYVPYGYYTSMEKLVEAINKTLRTAGVSESDINLNQANQAGAN